ncbi:AfsR/SARP family transcriptional regulator [Streptomyces sp. C10-9-1]|uniref:AfsR/SARP family transcriptional regulator n=1 Tax=Streptomyces sp. C10-9-1 TaxID=1859285 RepID=UPI003D75880C
MAQENNDVVGFCLLGAVGMRVGGQVVACGPPQQQAVLAALLLRAGHVVPSHELITAVWGEEPPKSAVKVLRTYVWRLRQLLRAVGGEEVLASVGDGYRVALAAHSVDALHADQLASAVAQSCRAGRHEECAELLDQACALWQGEPLSGVPGPFADGERARLAELRLTLTEKRYEHDLRCGRHREAVPPLAAFCREHPLREHAHATLMRALAASGRRADALAAFAHAREVLREELGLDPGLELRDLHESLLRDGADDQGRPPEPDAHASTDRPSEGRGATPCPQLPSGIADFCGREEVAAEVVRALTAPSRTGPALVSLTGMAGIGKSALALHAGHLVAHHFPDGQLYADLNATAAEPTDSATVLTGFLLALGVAREAIPSSPPERSRLLRTALRGRRVLLVLDDARDAEQLAPLMPTTPTCAVLVTSRSSLVDVSGCTHVRLKEFTTGESLALVRAIVGTSRVDREEADAVRLAAGCAHLPLAVRVVATRLASRPAWTVKDLVRCLTDERRRLQELYAEEVTLAASFELSHRRLSGPEASAFRVLAPVAWPSIGLPAAAAALGMTEDRARTLLESLVDVALLESPTPGRYRYHELVRGFALRLTPPGRSSAGTPESDERAAAPSLLLDHLLRSAAAAFQMLVPGDPVHNTLTVAAPPGAPASAIPFENVGAARAWVVTEFPCMVHLMQSALRHPEADQAPSRAALADLVVALSAFGRDIPYGQLASVARDLAEAAEKAGDRRTVGRARFVCGNAALQGGHLGRAAFHTRLAAEACARAGDEVILRQTYNDLGIIAYWEQRYHEATGYFGQAVESARLLGLRSGELNSRVNAALARIGSGQAEEGLAVCEQALDAMREMADRQGMAHALCVRGQALHALGRDRDALVSYLECLDVCEAAGLRSQQAQTRYHLSRTLGALNRWDAALAEAECAVSYFLALPDVCRHRGHALLASAEALLGRGDRSAAQARAAEAAEVFRSLGLPEGNTGARRGDLHGPPAPDVLQP